MDVKRGLNRGGTLACVGIGLVFFLAGCASLPSEPVIRASDVVTVVDSILRPETLLFPDYLLMEGFELENHGRVHGSEFIVASMKVSMPLDSVQQQLTDLLTEKAWRITKTEQSHQAFRLIAERKSAWLELRVVQGTGAARICLLYCEYSAPLR